MDPRAGVEERCACRPEPADPRLHEPQQGHRGRAHPRRAGAARLALPAGDPGRDGRRGHALQSRSRASRRAIARLIVEDVSLGFDELGNFPGPYVRWLLEAAGGKGLAAIAYALNNRAAKAQCCVGYWDGNDRSRSFSARPPARSSCSRAASAISAGTPGSSRAGSTKTFAEMTRRGEGRRLASRPQRTASWRSTFAASTSSSSTGRTVSRNPDALFRI